jgi:hypothetical protein
MTDYLGKKIRSARDLATYQYAQFWRPSADRAIGAIARNVQADGDGAILFEALWDHPHHWLRAAMFRVAAAPVFGPGLVGLREEDARRRAVDSLRALPLNAEEVVPRAVPERYVRAAQDLMNGARTPADLLDLTLPFGYPTHYLCDGIIKQEMVGQIDCAAPGTLRHIARALYYLDFYQEVFARHVIRAAVLSHPTNTRYSTLAWVALLRGIPVFILNYVNHHITLRKLWQPKDMLGCPNEYPEPALRDRLSNEQRKRLVTVGRKYLNLMHKGEESQFAMVGVYGDGRPHFPDRNAFAAAAGADPAKPNVMIMTNCWPDFPHNQGRAWYTDYVDWFMCAMNAIRHIDRFNWYLKPHPAEGMYGDRVSLRQLTGPTLPNGVFYWPGRANGVDAMAYMDCTVTAVGTAGIEYAASGRRVLAGGPAPYAGWGFVNVASDRQAFVDMLKVAPDLPAPGTRQMEDAAIYAALSLADPDEGEGRLFLPYGLLSYRLWPGLTGFIKRNATTIRNEIGLIRAWLGSDYASYGPFTSLYDDEKAIAAE